VITIKNLSKVYAGRVILDNVSCTVNKGEVIAIIGSSGSGKSTLLRCIQGLETKDQGVIELDVTSSKHITTVFQTFNLFPHLTVLQNITYAPIKVFNQEPSKAQQVAMDLLEKVGLKDYTNKYPKSLSGGQKQRVAIARALAINPEILLFDEPTSALDPENVQEVLSVINGLAHTGITLLIVTHEMQFAKNVADRIWFFDHGKLIEDTPAQQFFVEPQTSRAREFLGLL
jgi:polar amino acid transport system ATP-binding protein